MAKQLTERNRNNTFDGFLLPDNPFLFHVKNEINLQHVDINRLNKLTIYTIPDDWMSNKDRTLNVGDGSGSSVDVKGTASHKIENDQRIYILSLKKQQANKLAKHNSFWKVLNGDRQVIPPHPAFPLDNKYVLYSCGTESLLARYFAKVSEEMLTQI